MSKTFESIEKLHPILQEMLKQTTPENFMEPYNAAKVKMAMELNKQVLNINIKRPTEVLQFLTQTIDDLGCNYSADIVYRYLHQYYSPTANIYDDFVDWRNTLCEELYLNKESIPAMISTLNQKLIEKEDIDAKKRSEAEAQEADSNLFFIWLALGGIFILCMLFFAYYLK